MGSVTSGPTFSPHSSIPAATEPQDMKALRPNSDLDPVFLVTPLRAMHKSLLSGISTSSHGTKKLDTDVLSEIRIPLPPMELQQRLRTAWDRNRSVRMNLRLASVAGLNARDCLTQQAFQGQL